MQKVALFIIAISLSACECALEGNGWVYDQQSSQPISGATVTIIHHDQTTQTDSIGHFDIGRIAGTVSGCPDLKINITAPGYQDKEFTNPLSDTIYLEK